MNFIGSKRNVGIFIHLHLFENRVNKWQTIAYGYWRHFGHVVWLTRDVKDARDRKRIEGTNTRESCVQLSSEQE